MIEFNPLTGKLDKTLPVGMYYNKATQYLSIGRSGGTARLHIKGTTLNDVGRFDIGVDFVKVPDPVAPGVALLAVAGNINPGQHYYFVTYITALGETGVSAPGYGAPNLVTDAGHAQVQVTLPISPDYRVTGRKIYRAITGGIWWNNVLLVGTVNDNTTVTFIDNVSDANRTGPDSNSRDNTTNKFFLSDGSVAAYMGSSSTYLGKNAGLSILLGSGAGGENVFIGVSAGQAATISQKSVFVGVACGGGVANTSAVYIGHAAGSGASSDQSSIIIGRNSGWAYSGGGANVFMGYGAGGGAQAWFGYYNICLGNGAGTGFTVTPWNNIFLGVNSGANVTSGWSNILLGGFVQAPSPSANGQLNIGNLIYGTGLYNVMVNSSTPTIGGTLDFYALVTMKRGQKVNRTPVDVGAYVVLATDYIVGKTAITGGGDAVTLPNAVTCAGQVFTVKDESGTAAANNITIVSAGGLIDGGANKIINVNYGAFQFYSNGVNWFII